MPSFLPLVGRAQWAKRALIASVALGLVTLVADFQQWTLTKRLASGEGTLDELRTNDSGHGFLALTQLVALLAAGILFLCWFHRAYANLRAFGTEGLPHGPGWAVGYWFIPFVNLVRPATAARDIWNASDPAAGARSWHEVQAADVDPRLVVDVSALQLRGGHWCVALERCRRSDPSTSGSRHPARRGHPHDRGGRARSPVRTRDDDTPRSASVGLAASHGGNDLS